MIRFSQLTQNSKLGMVGLAFTIGSVVGTALDSLLGISNAIGSSVGNWLTPLSKDNTGINMRRERRLGDLADQEKVAKLGIDPTKGRFTEEEQRRISSTVDVRGQRYAVENREDLKKRDPTAYLQLVAAEVAATAKNKA
jgi:hypothetical protein